MSLFPSSRELHGCSIKNIESLPKITEKDLSLRDLQRFHTGFSTKSTGLFTKYAVTLDMLGFAPIYLTQ